MTSERPPRDPEFDPELEEWTADARGDEAPSADFAAMFATVERDIAKAEKARSFWLRSRPTLVRLGIAVVAASGLAAVGAVNGTPVSAGVVVAMVGLALVLFPSLGSALRPLHRPALPTWMIVALLGATVGLTLFVALAPIRHHHAGASAIGCFVYGTALGAISYAVVRVLDRGARGGALLAGAVATLVGNLALELHCPSADVAHRILGHFTITLFFLVVSALETVRRSRAR